MALIRLLFYFIIAYSIFRFISTLFRPTAKRHTNYTQNNNKRKEGDIKVNINHTPKQNKRISKDDGDYVDYEEI